MIALDTTALSILLIPGSQVFERGTTTPISYARERMEELVNTIERAGETIVIPSPVLAEIIVKLAPEDISNVVSTLTVSRWFRIEAFDATAAIELGQRTATALASGDKREGVQADHTKVKFDRQILTIALVSGAERIISNDPHVVALGQRWGFPVVGVHELPLPQFLVAPPLFAAMEKADGKVAVLKMSSSNQSESQVNQKT